MGKAAWRIPTGQLPRARTGGIVGVTGSTVIWVVISAMTATETLTEAPIAVAMTGGGGQLRGAQRRLDLRDPGIDAALPAAAAPSCGDLGPGQGRAGRRGRRSPEHLDCVAAGQVVERGQGGRVELPQRRTEHVRLAPPGPDHRLMRASQDLDRFGQVAVPGDRAVVVPVSADQVRQHLRVPRIRLRPGGRVPVPVTGH